MINVVDLYNSVLKEVNKSLGGYLSAQLFNDYLKRSCIDLLEWLTGSVVVNPALPSPFSTQKSYDYLSKFITEVSKVNEFEKPKDYYLFQALVTVGNYNKSVDCESDDVELVEGCDTPITLLDTPKFNSRCGSFIDGLGPIDAPIAKLGADNKFHFSPKDIGTVKLTYIRMPIFGELKMTIDQQYMTEIPDTVNSINCEFDMWAYPYLINLISDKFSTYTRDRNLKEISKAEKPIV